MDFRLVTDQDPEELYAKFVSYLKANGYGDVEIVKESAEPAARTSYKGDLAQAAIKGAKEVFQKDPSIEISSAGTGPLYIFTRRYGVAGLDIGISPVDSALHSPNENIRLDFLEKGMLWLGQTVENYIGG
jgi:acetylornithine deacetylase/succinyl-diaminopimelate desuccinylase-like protein